MRINWPSATTVRWIVGITIVSLILWVMDDTMRESDERLDTVCVQIDSLYDDLSKQNADDKILSQVLKVSKDCQSLVKPPAWFH